MTGVYQVTGRLNFRGHVPGTIFEARLDPKAERRALLRGDIRRLAHFTPTIQPGSYTLPRGWLNQNEEV